MFSLALQKIETRAETSKGNLDILDDFWYGIGVTPTFSGTSVNNLNAMQLWAVNACVTLISSAIAQLPLKLKRKEPNGGTEDAVDVDLYDIVKLSPNYDMTSFNWRESSMGHALTSGNSFSYIERAGREPIALWPLEPKRVKVKFASPEEKLRNKMGDSEKVIYLIDLDTGGVWEIPGRDMLHIVGFGWDGLTGESIITNFAKQCIGNGISLEKFQGNFFKNGVHTSGTFEHPDTLGDNLGAFITALRERYSGDSNSGTPMVLENGMKFTQNKVSLVDQQFLEQTKANALQICGMFHVPPSKIAIYGEGTSYNNTEQQNKNYLDDTLMHWIVRWEQGLDRKLLTPSQRKQGYFFKHNVDALLRPDAKTRAEISQIEWGMGVPLNESRKRNDLNPIPGGEKSYVPLNYISVDMIGQVDDEGERSKCGCGVEHEKRETSIQKITSLQTRNLQSRDRISQVWRPLIKRAASKLVRIETKAVRREADKNLKQRAKQSFYEWLDTFYESFSKIIEDELGSVVRGYQMQIAEQIHLEVGTKVNEDEVLGYSREYIAGMVRQWVNASRGQIVPLLKEDDPFEKINIRMDEWEEKRATKIERLQTPAALNAVAYTVIGAGGFSLVWLTRGKEDCPYCQSMNGVTIKSGESFIEEGSEIKSEGRDPFKVKNNINYPPIHGGCDCTIIQG